MAVNKNFIVKNGIEVKNNLIYADTDLNSVGIGTTIVQHKFHVIGGIGATTTVISGISTVGSLSVGSNEVISSARQLKNIASLDTTTQNTIEAATKGSPNEYDDLVVTGVSTFKADVIAEDNLLVSGIATFTGTPNLPGANVSGVSTFAALVDANAGVDVTGHSELDNVNVSGVSTFAGIGTFSSHLYVGGNLNVVGDVVYDEVTGRNINITGLGTIAQFNSTNAVLGVATATTFSGDLTGTVNTAAQPNITSLGTIAQLGATNANVTGVGTVAQFNATNAVLGVATITTANITNPTLGNIAHLNATNAVVGVATFTTATIGTLVGGLSGVSTEFTGQIGIQSGGVRIGTGVTQLNFVGSGNTFQYNPSTDTVDITISGGGGGGGGGSVSIGQTAPVTPSSGDLWFNIDIARTFVYYDEAALGVGSSAFWVDASPFEASGMFLSKMGDNMLAGLGITAGTISAPGLYFNGDTNTGLYSPAADQFAFTAGGVGIATFQSGILEAGGARFSSGGVTVGVITATSLEASTSMTIGGANVLTDAAPQIQLVASGTIPANKPVVIRNDNKVGVVTGTNFGFGDKNAFGTSSNTWSSIAWDTANSRVVVVWRDGTGAGKCKVGTVTGTSISWGSSVDFTSNNPYWPRVIFNSNTGKVVIVYSDANDNNKAKCVIGTVSGTSISFGSIVNLESSGTNSAYAQFALFNVGTTNKFIVAYRTQGDSDVVVGSISGTTPSFGTAGEVTGENWSFVDGAWDASSETGVIIWYNSGGQLQSKCVSVSGTSLDRTGEIVQITNGNTQQAYPTVQYDPVNKKIMIAWMSQAETTSPERGLMIATGIAFNIGGGTKRALRVQSVRLIEDIDAEYLSSTFDTVNNEMILAYRGASYQAARYFRAKIISGDIDDPTSSLGIGNTFGGYERVAVTTPVGFAGSYPMAYYSSMAFDPTGKKVFAGFPYYYESGQANAVTGAVWVANIADSNLTSENFLGFSKASYTDGQTATISLSGAVNTSQVGLSTTKNYYVLPDASLTNSPSVSGQFFNDPEGKYGYISAGIALSATSLLIKT